MAIRPVQDAPKKEAKKRKNVPVEGLGGGDDSPGHDTKHGFGFGSFGSFSSKLKYFRLVTGQSKSPLLSRVRLRYVAIWSCVLFAAFFSFVFRIKCSVCVLCVYVW